MATSIPKPRPERKGIDEAGWSPGFFEKLSAVDSETAAAVDEMLAFGAPGKEVEGSEEMKP